MDEIEMQLTGRENSRLLFTHEAAQLAPGRNELTLFCPVSLVITKYQRARLMAGYSRPRPAPTPCLARRSP